MFCRVNWGKKRYSSSAAFYTVILQSWSKLTCEEALLACLSKNAMVSFACLLADSSLWLSPEDNHSSLWAYTAALKVFCPWTITVKTTKIDTHTKVCLSISVEFSGRCCALLSISTQISRELEVMHWAYFRPSIHVMITCTRLFELVYSLNRKCRNKTERASRLILIGWLSSLVLWPVL